MTTFTGFMAATNKKYLNCTEAMAVYNFLSLDESVERMTKAIEEGKPALEGVVGNLEKIFKNNQKFDFNNNEVRTIVGKLVKEIIASYGYLATTDAELTGTMFFKNAMRYELKK